MASSNDDVGEIIMSVLCQYGCQSSVQQLFDHLTGKGIRINDHRYLLRFLEKYPNLFCLRYGRRASDAVVYIHAPVPLCSDHCTKNAQCQDNNCNGLHVCKFFLLSKCGHQSCAYGHTLQTQHNLEVLQPYLMDRLRDNDIRVILGDIRNRTYLTKPEICRFYNIAQGCNKPKCPFLHVCNHFILNTCKFGYQCKRSHSITDLDVLYILERYGINTARSETEILADLRVLFEISNMPLSRHGSVSSLDGLPQSSQIKNRRSRSAASRQRNRRKGSPSPGPQGPVLPPDGPYAQSSYGQPFSPLENMYQGPPLQYPRAMDFQGARPKVMPQSSMNPRGQGQAQMNMNPRGQGQAQMNMNPRGQGQAQMNMNPRSQGQVVKTPYGKQMSEPSDKEKLEICMYKLKGKCWYGQQCVRHHKDTLYQWQFLLDDNQEWQDFDGEKNLDLETNFCQPEKNECFVRMFGEVMKISFAEPMTGEGKKFKIDVRRLSTMSSEDPSAQPAMVQWTTEWRWYWEGPGGEWILYGEKDSTGMKSKLSSETIETRYLENTKGMIDFQTNQFTYKLNFNTMKQENAKLSTQREVKRRPQFFKKEDLSRRTSAPQSGSDTVPKEWSVQNFKTVKALMGHYAETEVDSDSEEFSEVEELFGKTTSHKIGSITRIENGELWSSFSLKKTQMTTKAVKTVKELGLFHGTDEQTIPPICHQGFDFRFSGSRVGAKLGKGSYFARDSKYSTSYTQPDKRGLAKMFMARVLVGEYTVGSRDYVRPPQKSVNDPYELYDSCVDNPSDPSIYVVFSLEQSYPEYLITYSVK